MVRRRGRVRAVADAQNNPAREALGSPARFYFPHSGARLLAAVPMRGPPMAAIFLDLYGVLADSMRMNAEYNRRMSEICVRRFGGTFERWRAIQEASFAWYQQEGAKLDARPGPEREGARWVEAVAALNAGQIEWMFPRA